MRDLEQTLISLRESVAGKLSEKRFQHTVGVEKTAIKLSGYFSDLNLFDLRAAALLHDIAKELPIEICHQKAIKCPISKDFVSLSTPSALHAYAGAALIVEDYPQFANAQILSAVAKHTLGAPSMNVFDKIIFIADYIEEGRTYPSSIKVRNYLLGNLTSDIKLNENILNNAIVMAICLTEEFLKQTKSNIDEMSILTKNSLLS